MDEYIEVSLLRPKYSTFKASAGQTETITLGQERASIVDENHVNDYKCPRVPCTASFNSYELLQEHISSNVCHITTKDETMMQQIKRLYFSRFSLGSTSASVKIKTHLEALLDIEVPKSLESDKVPTYPTGFAQSTEHITYVALTPKHKTFFLQIFNEGQVTKQKVKAEVARNRMREALNDEGGKLFDITEYVKTSQIRTFFNACFAKVKNSGINDGSIEAEASGLDQEDLDDLEADQQLADSATLRDTLITTLDQSDDDGFHDNHPLEMNHMDLCLLACDYKAKKSQPRAKLFLQEYQTNEVKALLEALEISPLPKLTYRGMAKAIFKYVQEKCPNNCTQFA